MCAVARRCSSDLRLSLTLTTRALLLLPMTQTAHQPRIKLLISLALLKPLAVVLGALQQDDAHKCNRQEEVCTCEFVQAYMCVVRLL